MPKLLLLTFFTVTTYATEPFPEQTPLQMTNPNTNKEHPAKWIPLSSNFQEAPTKNIKISDKSINDSIKNQIQKKMQALLKPLKDEEADQ